MVLRDFFTELEDIFDFHFEKNKNGSYRVNTVIASLVYPAFYKDGTFSDNDLRYFLAHPQDSYQNYPNIRNSFSELMNPKENSHRFPILEFCSQIDIPQMYDYYDLLCSNLMNHSPEKYQRLLRFLKRIADNDPIFYAKLKLICDKPCQFLTWILIFSMFNSELANKKFEEYLKLKETYIPNISITESDVRHKLSLVIQKRRHRLNLLTILLIILNGCMVICSLMPYFLLDKWDFLTTPSNHNLFYLFLLIFSILILLLWKCHTYAAEQCSNLQSLHDYMDLFPSTPAALNQVLAQKKVFIIPFQNESFSHQQRNRTRKIITPVAIAVCLIAIIPSLQLNSFPLLVGFTAFIILITLYIDLMIHNYRTRTYYDLLSEPEGTKGNQYRGLAKIYRWEYEKTCFNFKDDYYDNPVQVHSSACYKHIFYIAYDRIRYSLFYRHSLFLWFNVCILFLDALNFFWGNITTYLRLPGMGFFDLFITIYLIALGIYNITSLLNDVNSYSYLSLLAYGSSHAEENAHESERLFLSLRAKGVIQEADWVRGVSTYDMALFEKGYQAEDIFPESDRMQFHHRTYQLKSLSFYTACIGYVILFCIFVWHFGLYWLTVPFSILAPLGYYLTNKFYLERRHQKRVIREIRKLQARGETTSQ